MAHVIVEKTIVRKLQLDDPHAARNLTDPGALSLQVRFLARSFGVPGDHAGQVSQGYRWPFGPVGLITPFNFPLEIPALQVLPLLGHELTSCPQHRKHQLQLVSMHTCVLDTLMTACIYVVSATSEQSKHTLNAVLPCSSWARCTWATSRCCTSTAGEPASPCCASLGRSLQELSEPHPPCRPPCCTPSRRAA